MRNSPEGHGAGNTAVARGKQVGDRDFLTLHLRKPLKIARDKDGEKRSLWAGSGFPKPSWF